MYIGSLALQSKEVSNWLALQLNLKTHNQIEMFNFHTREIKEKLQLQANADEKMQTIRKEIETEYAARSKELGEMYVAEKKKFQGCLQVKLSE